MIESLVKANLNLYAVMRNLPEVVANDPVARQAAADWQIAIQYAVWRGPAAWVAFENGVCTFGRGRHPNPDLFLWFVTPNHFNRMMTGKARPFVLKGFKRLGFMRREFPEVTGRLAFFLKYGDTALAEPQYLALAARLKLSTAVFAARELALFDPLGRLAAARIRNGAVQIRILPDGPAAHLIFTDGEVTPGIGEVQRPMARMDLRDTATASAFFSGRLDPFTASATEEVAICGQIPMIEGLVRILDRLPRYLG